MNIFKTAFTSVFALSFALAQVHADEIKITKILPKEGPHLVKITHADKIKFELCQTSNPDVCIAIGRVDGYTQDELVKARNNMNKQFWWRSLGTGGLVAIGLGGGVVVGGALTTLATIPIIFGAPGLTTGTVTLLFAAPGTAGAAIGLGTAAIFRLTPGATLRAKNALNEEIISASSSEKSITSIRTYFHNQRYKTIEAYVASLTLALNSLERKVKVYKHLNKKLKQLS